MKMKELEKDELLRVDGGRGLRELIDSYYERKVYDERDRLRERVKELERRIRVDDREIHERDRGKSGLRRAR